LGFVSYDLLCERALGTQQLPAFFCNRVFWLCLGELGENSGESLAVACIPNISHATRIGVRRSVSSSTILPDTCTHPLVLCDTRMQMCLVYREKISGQANNAAVMAGFLDRIVGLFFVIVSLVVFTYYTTWAIILPYLHRSHWLVGYFPQRIYAIYLPLLLLVVGVSGVGAYLYRIKRRAWRDR